MRYYTCFYRHRDNSGKIIGYTLRSEDSWEWMQVTPEQLKDALRNKRVFVFNLKLTSDGRIIEAPNNQYQNKLPGRLHENYTSYANVQIKNDSDKLDYTREQIKKDIMDKRVKFDSVFEINKIMRFFTKGRKGKTVPYGGTRKGYGGEDGKDAAAYNVEGDGDYDGYDGGDE